MSGVSQESKISILRVEGRSHCRPIGSRRRMRSFCIAAAAVSSIVMTSLLLASPTTASAADPIVGNWNVTYGNADVVAMTLPMGCTQRPPRPRFKVVGASCSLPVGTVIATFSSTGGD